MIPVFDNLPDAERKALFEAAQGKQLAAGDVLFYEGDPADTLYLLQSGCCQMSFGKELRGKIEAGLLIDPIGTLGGLPHTVKVTAVENAQLLCWPMETLLQSANFSAAARRYLAKQLHQSTMKLAQLTAPLHFAHNTAELVPGPFMFEDTSMIFAFCEADPPSIEKCLPESLHLLQRPAKKRAPLLIALADFPHAYPQHTPSARFAYTETTYFIPVRYGTTFGFYVPHIYPSTYEPILLGREIYGFPKRLGETIFGTNEVSLSVDGEKYVHLSWQGAESETETRLVRGLMDWLGLEGRVASAAFQAGEVLRKATRLPAYRRVNVFNHKQILAAESNQDSPLYAVNQLTQAAFGVLRWYHINRLSQPELRLLGGAFSDAHLTLREAFRTKLDMRLSTARVIMDYPSLAK